MLYVLSNNKHTNCKLEKEIGMYCRVRGGGKDSKSGVLIILVFIIKFCKSCYTYEVLHYKLKIT